MKISNLFKIQKKATLSINDFYLGYHHLIVMEIKELKNKVIFDKVITNLLKNNHSNINNSLRIYWFGSYLEMEQYLESFLDSIDHYFVFIG